VILGGSPGRLGSRLVLAIVICRERGGHIPYSGRRAARTGPSQFEPNTISTIRRWVVADKQIGYNAGS
jgi:hypothetical protein